MKFLCVFAAALFWLMNSAFAHTNRPESRVARSVGKAQNQVIKELKKQNENMKAMMEELSLKLLQQVEELAQQDRKYEEKLAYQEQKLAQQQEEIASLKSEMTTKLEDVRYRRKRCCFRKR